MEWTPEMRRKLSEVISKGLVSGLGEPEPGKMCVEAAICYVLGLPHSDVPPCVAEPDRAYAININDARWSSPQARAEALLPLALAQLDTKGKSRVKWAQALALGAVRKVLPIILRQHGMDDYAMRCENVKDLQEARDAARAAAHAAHAAHATYATYAAADADAAATAAYAADATATATATAATAAYAADADEILKVSVQVALDAYQEEEK